jgi:hypothetical protein
LKGLNATRRDAPNPPNVPDLQRFQAFYRRDEEELLGHVKVSSSMSAFDLSLTRLFKLIGKRLR